MRFYRRMSESCNYAWSNLYRAVVAIQMQCVIYNLAQDRQQWNHFVQAIANDISSNIATMTTSMVVVVLVPPDFSDR
eukprot:1862196-Amphidinium_carterae.1